MKKKFVSIVLTALMVVTMTTGCGESKTETPAVTPSPASNPGTESQTGTGAAGDTGNQSVTPAPETSTDAPQQVLTRDYDELAVWVRSGLAGTSPSGKEVLLGLNMVWDYGILLVYDDSDRTVFGYEGAIERSYDDSVNYGHITIAGQEFGYKELADGEWEIDMGDELGVTIVATQTYEILTKRLKVIFDEYTFVD